MACALVPRQSPVRPDLCRMPAPASRGRCALPLNRRNTETDPPCPETERRQRMKTNPLIH